MKQLYLLSFLLGFSWNIMAQFQLGVSIGNSNFRRIIPYTGTVKNFPFTFFAKGSLAYQFKQHPYRLDMDVAFLTGNSWEESFDGGLKRAYARFYNPQSYMAFINYLLVEKSKITMFCGGGFGYFRTEPNIFYVAGGSGYNTVYYDKSTLHRFSFGAKSGITLGKKRLQSKIELRHFFLSGYDFAGFAKEMNTSLSIGLVYNLSSKE